MIKQVKVGVTRLISLKKFENVRYECEVVADVPSDKTEDEVYNECLLFCQNKVRTQMERLSED